MRGLGPRAPRIYRFRARMARGAGRLAALAIPASESALRSLPSVAVSSAQVTAILNPTSGVGGEFTLFY
jgi:hypothetical protein